MQAQGFLSLKGFSHRTIQNLHAQYHISCNRATEIHKETIVGLTNKRLLSTRQVQFYEQTFQFHQQCSNSLMLCNKHYEYNSNRYHQFQKLFQFQNPNCISLSRNRIQVKQLHQSHNTALFSLNKRELCRIQESRVHQDSHRVELSSKRYPHVKRGPYSTLTEKDITYFEELLPQRVVTDRDELEACNVDWLKTCRGESQLLLLRTTEEISEILQYCNRHQLAVVPQGESRLLLLPRSTQEVSEILQYCNSHRLAVVPQGGNTGLSGGAVPVFDEVVLSTRLMNRIVNFDPLSGVLECQAGCILENLESHLNEHDMSMPLDLGAKGSCHIGGNVATNAGGLRVLRYGSLHGNVLGLEAVLADGTVLDCMSSLRKDNTGYDVKQMLIGSEGTLGVITAVSILCVPRPSHIQVAFLGCDSFEKVKHVFREAKSSLGEILSAFEFLDDVCITMAQKHLGLRCPITNSRFYALIETAGSNSRHDEEKLNFLLEKLMNEGTVTDGTMATEGAKVKELWSLRERMAEAMLLDGYNFKYDLSIPLTCFYDLVDILRERLGSKVKTVIGYGHVGDSNLHINVTTPTYSHEVHDLLEPFIYDWVAEKRGSVSAEHGLGFKKTDYIYHSNSNEAVTIMGNIKQLFDPVGILNPYKVFPSKVVK